MPFKYPIEWRWEGKKPPSSQGEMQMHRAPEVPLSRKSAISLTCQLDPVNHGKEIKSKQIEKNEGNSILGNYFLAEKKLLNTS